MKQPQCLKHLMIFYLLLIQTQFMCNLHAKNFSFSIRSSISIIQRKMSNDEQNGVRTKPILFQTNLNLNFYFNQIDHEKEDSLFRVSSLFMNNQNYYLSSFILHFLKLDLESIIYNASLDVS
ncbi:hypothetical protein BpHYR1_000206 [Brachionus plicatilis]|uniref:Transmembrane protein n=1 Tax=Brachionus plicatilis TaxID=10195 RepID=A0A3M7SDL6_BRAPC|nr:hypothetical protein BpHYR1_000206 [Brachionus plicatilis]